MKKSSISKVLVMSLLAFTALVGCDGESSSSMISSSEDQYVENIAIQRIESAVVGDVIDLRDYVTIDGTTNEFEVEVTTLPTASVDGYNLLVLGEGKVSVWIKAGDKKQILEFNAISETLNKFKIATENVKYNFFLAEYSTSESGAYVISDNGNLYNESYSATYDGYSDTPSYTGFIFGPDYSKQFTMDDLSGKNYRVLPGNFSSVYYEATEWELTYNLLSTVYQTASTSYLVGGPDAADAILSTLGYINSTSMAALYKQVLLEDPNLSQYLNVNSVVEVNMMVDILEDDDLIVPAISVYLNIDDEISIDIGINYCLFSDEDYYTLDFVQETIDNDSYTPSVVPTELFDKVTEIVNAKNYTLNADLNWRNYETGEVADAPEGWDVDFENSIYGQAMFSFSASQLVTENATKLCLKDGRYEKYTKVGEKVELETNIDEENTSNTLGTPVTSETDFDGIWEGSNKLTGLINTLENNTFKDSINVIIDNSSNVTDPEKDYYYAFNGVGKGSNYLVNLLSLVPFNGAMLKEVYGYTLAQLNNVTFGELLNLTAYTYITEDSLSFNMVIRWSTNLSFEINMDFTDIGTTVIE